MHISGILRTKGSEVATVDPAATVEEAAGLLARQGIGALVVSGDGQRIDGILSERDIARAVGTRGAAALAVAVRDVMTAEVTTCGLADTVDELMGVMTEQRIRHLPVTDAGAMVGIVSIGDVVKHRMSELETETRTLHDYIELGR